MHELSARHPCTPTGGRPAESDVETGGPASVAQESVSSVGKTTMQSAPGIARSTGLNPPEHVPLRIEFRRFRHAQYSCAAFNPVPLNARHRGEKRAAQCAHSTPDSESADPHAFTASEPTPGLPARAPEPMPGT